VPGPDAGAPYVVAFPEFARITETSRLPNHGQGFAISGNAAVNQTLGGIEWRRSAGIDNGVATISASIRSVAPEFPASEAPAVQQGLRDMAHHPVDVVQTGAYHRTPQEVAAARMPVTAQDYAQQGSALVDAGNYADAVSMFGKALALDSHAAWALAERGIAQAALGHAALATQDFDSARADAAVQPSPAPTLNAMCWRKATQASASGAMLAAALADCDAALTLMPAAFQIMDSRGVVLLRLGRNDAAIEQYGKALAIESRLASSLYGRALAEARLGQNAAHDRDAAAALAIDPTVTGVFSKLGLKPEGAAPLTH
jgi:tetratricopeptide (TPR) repeat protein